MVGFKKFLVHLLSLFLFIFLLGTVFTTTANQTFGQPKKLEGILHDSGVYKGLTSSLLKQAEKDKSKDNTNEQDSVSLTNSQVQQAAQAALSPELMEKSVNAFLDGNYAWLQGKTDKPVFNIDLTQAKQTFITEVGKAVEQHVASLPVCTAEQLAQIDPNNIDYLNLTCRPPTLSASAANSQIVSQLSTGDFLKEPVVTPSTLQETKNAGTNPNPTPTDKPYYEKLSNAPKLYRLSQKLPIILGLLSVLTALGILFLALTKRQGANRIAIVLTITGILLILGKFMADAGFNRAEDSINGSPDIGQLQQPIVDVLHKIETHMVALNLTFGIVFVVVATAIFVYLNRTKPGVPSVPHDSPKPETPPEPPVEEDKKPPTAAKPSKIIVQ